MTVVRAGEPGSDSVQVRNLDTGELVKDCTFVDTDEGVIEQFTGCIVADEFEIVRVRGRFAVEPVAMPNQRYSAAAAEFPL